MATSRRGTGNEPWSYRLEAVITPRKYWSTQGQVFGTWDRVHAEAFARARELTRLSFYGIGAGTSRDARTSYRYTDRSAGGLLSALVIPRAVGVRLGARVEGLWPDVGEGKDDDVPSIEQLFTETGAPGLAAQPSFGAYSGFAIVTYPDNLNMLASRGVDARVDYTAYRAHGSAPYDFGRLSAELQERVPGFRPSHRLTLHQLFSTSSTTAGNDVPFYLQPTLGGAGAVRGFNEEILGSDATKATLRGFEDLRFRGPHLLLLQAEYRFKVYGPVDATVFADAGKVAATRGELDLNGLKHNVGFSLSFMTIDATAFRLDVGTGGGEGTHLFFSVGPVFQR